MDFIQEKMRCGERVLDIAFKLVTEYRSAKLGSETLKFYMWQLMAEQDLLNGIEMLEVRAKNANRINLRKMWRNPLLSVFRKRQHIS